MAEIATPKNFKAYLIESIKVAGQMMVDMAEDIAGCSDHISGLNVSIGFDPSMRSIPELTITRSHLPDYTQVERLMAIYDRKITKEETKNDC